MKFDQPETTFNRSITFIVCAALILTLVLSALPQTQAAAVVCKYKHKVLQGETLTYISNLYGINWTKIADANKMSAPYTVMPGQVLCIPEGDKTSSGTSSTPTKKGSKATLTVSPGISQVLVAVENFPKRTSYYVRVTPSNKPISYRIGVFTTNKEGDFTDWFNLPAYVRRSSTMTLCVKNVWTDAASCVKYDDMVFAFPFLMGGKCPPKEGR